MKGTGLVDKLIKYGWVEQPNGRFSIFNVPIFKLYKDKKKGELTKNDAKEVIKNAQEAAKLGKFPSLHIGHHQLGSAANTPGAGYLDNISFSEADDTFYADFVELYPEVFQQIKNLLYPERSVEYLTDQKKIKGLALLESQPGYF